MGWDDHVTRGTAALLNADYPSAEAEFAAALQIARSQFDHTDSRILQSLSFLGQVYFKQLRFDDAEPLLRQAVKLDKTKASDCYANDLYALACIESKTGRTSEAQEHFSEALPLLTSRVSERKLKEMLHEFNLSETANSTTASAAKPLEPQDDAEFAEWEKDIRGGLLLLEDRDNSQLITAAYMLLHQALSRAYRLFGRTHPNTAESLNAIALALHYLELVEQAESSYLQAIKIGESTLGRNHLAVARYKLNLATMYKEFDRYGPADMYFRQAFNVMEHDPEKDPQWFDETAREFTAMLERSRAEAAAYKLIQEAQSLERAGEYQQASQRMYEAHSLLKDHFPVGSRCYALVFSMQSQYLRLLGNTAEANALQEGADYNNQVRIQKEAARRELAQSLPPLPRTE